MGVAETERDILNIVGRLEKASIVDIQKKVGFSIHYVEYLCKYLVRKDYLTFSKEGRYSLTKSGRRLLIPISEQEPKMSGKLVKEIAGQVAKEISSQIADKTKGISVPLGEREEKVKIRTDFDFPVEDESLSLKTNINKVGIKVERETSDIDESIKSLTNIKKTKDKGKKR